MKNFKFKSNLEKAICIKFPSWLGGIMNWSYFSTLVTTHKSKFAQHVISWCLLTNTERVYVMHLFKQDLRNE